MANLGSIKDKAKEKIPKECRIDDTCLTSFAVIGSNLYTTNPKNLNHLYKDSKYIMSVINILGIDVNFGETFFIMERI